jgi:hypothetical protein
MKRGICAITSLLEFTKKSRKYQEKLEVIYISKNALTLENQRAPSLQYFPNNCVVLERDI